MLVAAMLAPERSEQPQFQVTGITAKAIGNRLIFSSGKGYFVELRLRNRHGGKKISRESGESPAWIKYVIPRANSLRLRYRRNTRYLV